MAECYEYFVDAAGPESLSALAANLCDLGGKGWRLVAVVPDAAGPDGGLLLFWERGRPPEEARARDD